MDSFKWNVLIIDDQSPFGNRNSDTVNYLLECGLHAQVLGSPVSELWEHYESLYSLDFAYCDMNWRGIRDYEQELFLPRDMPARDPKDYIKQWVKAIAYWIDQPNASSRHSDWPRQSIDADHAGLWLAALLKKTSPDVQIILYSQDGRIAQVGPLAAIGLFPDTSFQVITKDPVELLEVNRLRALIKQAQRDRLRRPDLRRWFLTDVLIRCLAGEEPKDRELQSLHGNDKLLYKANLFFPSFTGTSDFQLENVLDLLDFGSELSVWQRSALEDLKHRIERVLEPELPVDDEQLRSLLSYSYDCGEAGEPLGVALQATSTSNREKVHEALGFCRSALANRESDLVSLCAEHNGTVEYDTSAPVFKPASESCGDRINPILPFQYYYLRRSVNALGANAHDHRPVGALSTRLDAIVSDQRLIVVWSDNSEGFASWADFRAALVNSIDYRGAYRGFPLGVLFGLRYNSLRIEVLIRNGSSWHTLWPPGENIPVEAPNRTMSFGMRWTFDYSIP